jgi:hypothetical protein
VKNGRQQVEIIALYQELGSFRAVAALVGCDHKTVKHYVELAGERGQLAPAQRRARLTDDFRELIGAKVEASGGRITARRLLRVVRAAGYEAQSAPCAGRWPTRGAHGASAWSSRDG